MSLAPAAQAGDADEPLLELLGRLRERDYRFVPPTPETHRRVVERAAEARDLRGVFGWSLPFRRGLLAVALLGPLEAAGMIEEADGLCRSRLRVASAAGTLFLHSAYPTDARDSVFFGPDSYRFIRFLRAELSAGPARHLGDIGAGAGVGAIAAGLGLSGARLTLTDVNGFALRLARINARHAGLEVETLVCSGLEGLEAGFDLAIMNPPFIVDEEKRDYRDGGGMHGAALSLEWALAAAAGVEPGGRVLLYTGSAIVDGQDHLERALRERLPSDCTLRYEEIDPDIFGEQLDEPGYEDVERIAAVGAVIAKSFSAAG